MLTLQSSSDTTEAEHLLLIWFHYSPTHSTKYVKNIHHTSQVNKITKLLMLCLSLIHI